MNYTFVYRLEAENNLVKAMKHYKKALSVDATSAKAKDKTESLSAILQKQVFEKVRLFYCFIIVYASRLQRRRKQREKKPKSNCGSRS